MNSQIKAIELRYRLSGKEHHCYCDNTVEDMNRCILYLKNEVKPDNKELHVRDVYLNGETYRKGYYRRDVNHENKAWLEQQFKETP